MAAPTRPKNNTPFMARSPTRPPLLPRDQRPHFQLLALTSVRMTARKCIEVKKAAAHSEWINMADGALSSYAKDLADLIAGTPCFDACWRALATSSPPSQQPSVLHGQ